MAPEVMSSQKDLDLKKADVYSFGVLFAHVWNDKVPFAEYTELFQFIDAISHGARPVLEGKCPTQLTTFIANCWSAEPSERPSFTEIVDFFSRAFRKLYKYRLQNRI